jgi:hypothetical protein
VTHLFVHLSQWPKWKLFNAIRYRFQTEQTNRTSTLQNGNTFSSSQYIHSVILSLIQTYGERGLKTSSLWVRQASPGDDQVLWKYQEEAQKLGRDRGLAEPGACDNAQALIFQIQISKYFSHPPAWSRSAIYYLKQWRLVVCYIAISINKLMVRQCAQRFSLYC